MLLSRNMFPFFFLTTVAAVIAAAAPSEYRNSSASDSGLAARSATGADGTFDGCQYQVEGVGAFSSHLAIDFTTMDTLPDDLIASTYAVGPGPYAPYAHIFNPSNIVLASGQPMQMIVPGGQTADPLDTCQLVTRFDDVLYASVRTVAQASPVNGTVHGFFMYMNDTQETDIEIRTGDPGNVHFTNQQTHPGSGETTYAVPAPSTMSTAFHEYRYDWLPTGTNFYIDGVLVMTITRNVPSTPGWLMWNSWSNGYAWTYGPPAQDSILQIRSVEAFFNRTSVDTSNCTASSENSAGNGAVATSAGARITTNAAAVSNPPPSTTEIPSSTTTTTETQPSSTDDGTSNSTTQMSLATRLAPKETEKTSDPATFDDTHANDTLQITTGIAPEWTSTAEMTLSTTAAAAAPTYAGFSFQQLLQLHIDVRLGLPESI